MCQGLPPVSRTAGAARADRALIRLASSRLHFNAGLRGATRGRRAPAAVAEPRPPSTPGRPIDFSCLHVHHLAGGRALASARDRRGSPVQVHRPGAAAPQKGLEHEARHDHHAHCQSADHERDDQRNGSRRRDRSPEGRRRTGSDRRAPRFREHPATTPLCARGSLRRKGSGRVRDRRRTVASARSPAGIMPARERGRDAAA